MAKAYNASNDTAESKKITMGAAHPRISFDTTIALKGLTLSRIGNYISWFERDQHGEITTRDYEVEPVDESMHQLEDDLIRFFERSWPTASDTKNRYALASARAAAICDLLNTTKEAS